MSTNTSTAKPQWPEPTVPEPTENELWDIMMDIELPTATDGCTIEPDGICQHGHPSWLLRLEII